MFYDERWKDSYDAWKLATLPEYDGDGDEPDPCDHEDYEVDILAGRAECCMCSHSWYQTAEDIEREIERIRQHDEMMRCDGCRPVPAFRAEASGRGATGRRACKAI